MDSQAHGSNGRHHGHHQQNHGQRKQAKQCLYADDAVILARFATDTQTIDGCRLKINEFSPQEEPWLENPGLNFEHRARKEGFRCCGVCFSG
jgi:hypothetical protein